MVEALKHICFVRQLWIKHHEQIDALLQSNVSVIIWIGFHALENAITGGVWGIEALSKNRPSNQPLFDVSFVLADQRSQLP